MVLKLFVDDAFEFEDGRIVFTGRLNGESAYLKPCRADLLIAGAVHCSLELEEEMIPLKRTDSSLRSVSTRDRPGIDLKSLPKGAIVLRLRESASESARLD